MIHDKRLGYLLARASDRNIEVNVNERDDIVVVDRDIHAFKQLASSLGWRSSGGQILRDSERHSTPDSFDVVPLSVERRRLARRAERGPSGKGHYSVWTA